MERQLRAFGAELIQRATVLLRLPQLTGVSAVVIMQRFYFRRSLADFDVRVAAPAALLLACKLEETHRSLKEILAAFHRMRTRSLSEGRHAERLTPTLETSGGDHSQLKQAVISAERHMLRELGFAVALLLEHPHKYVLQFVKSLKKVTDWVLCELAQTAWNYLNDAMRTTLCCEHQPHEIAAASIFLAARRVGLRMPQQPPWWQVFDTEGKDLRCIARTIMALYRRRPLQEADVALLSLGSSSGGLLRRASSLPETPTPAETPRPLPSPASDETPCSRP